MFASWEWTEGIPVYACQQDRENDLKEAQQGNAEDESAQLMLGELYEHGNGIAQDMQAARLCYRKAAESHHPLAQKALLRVFPSHQQL